VNSVLLKNPPVADPKTLVRLWDDSDCCVGGGIRDNGDYGLFSTDGWNKRGLSGIARPGACCVRLRHIVGHIMES
jgi:hypothetical protein